MFTDNLISAGISHSCYPNSGFNIKNELVTIYPVRDNEPRTVDFSTLYTGSKVLMKCQCGFNGCRGSIRGFDQIPVIFQEKYTAKGVVPVLTRLNSKT